MVATTDEPVDRLSTSFSDDVPHGDFHAADGRHDSGAALILIADHAADNSLNVKGIFTQDAVFHPLVQECLNRFFSPFQRGLSHTGEIPICLQADEEIISQSRIC